jgi:hypothetical protein
LVSVDDVNLIKKHILNINTIEWQDKELGVMCFPEISGGADKESEQLKAQISSSEDTITATGTTFYVSENGKPENDGKSKDKPISINEVYSLKLSRGDAVLFKRGDTFRLTEYIRPEQGVSYGAYGSGDKPILSGSLKNYAIANIWTSDDNRLWKAYLGTNDAAQIVFNEGECIGYRKDELSKVHFNGDFYYDAQSKYIYLYLNQINPGKYFNSIEIATTDNAFRRIGGYGGYEAEDIKFENLNIKYIGIFGFNIGYCENVEIINCEFSWIGGVYRGDTGERYGNAIQLWQHANNCNVSNNYFNQIFDAAITFQGLKDNIYTNLTFYNNLIERCSMNFEFWGQDDANATDTSSAPGAEIKNIEFKNNILRFSGYGFGGMQRKNNASQAFILTWGKKYDEGQVQNFTISENIFDIARSNFFYSDVLDMHEIINNKYYQKSGNNQPVVRGLEYFSTDKDTFESAIKTADTNPALIQWLE